MCFRPAEVGGFKNICKKCGTENDSTAEKCSKCGAELKALPPLPGMGGGMTAGSKAPGSAPSFPQAPAVPAPPAAGNRDDSKKENGHD